ncbi:methyl-accepting chemotaxis protein [Sulfitobacter mediterraneus]|uniref:methyl-accepting chemotaxis protein n=1 Tax=Sulfitobacter mediterraneus TaxID=83219 RepID=UPI0021A6A342|nr:methyl-accepting chemotaxis protein [Sulfitobacter mediterraneus]UWR12994.1 methyl-accepting chemotaxis protein [Sulfitobacter mediterraneus]
MSRLSVSIKLAAIVGLLCIGILGLVTTTNISRQTDALGTFGHESLTMVTQLGETKIASAESDAEIKLQFIIDLLISVSGDALASYNAEMLDKIIAAVLVDPSVVHVAFNTVDGVELAQGGTVPTDMETRAVTATVAADGTDFGTVIVTRSYAPIVALKQNIDELTAQKAKMLTTLSDDLRGSTINASIRFAAIAAVLAAVAVYAVTVFMVGGPLSISAKLIEKITNDETDFERPKMARRKDEIGKLGKAIDMFRDTVVKARDMQRTAAARAAQDEAEEKARRIAKTEAAQRRADAEAAEAERRRAEEAERAAERDAMRAQADADRQAILDQQARVVDTLANALKRLSGGDLNVSIDAVFEGPYEGLRSDFNSTVETLQTAISAVALLTSTIRGETAAISSGANDLSQRTEKQAATLEETTAALTELNASVHSASGRAQDADERAQSARIKADESGEVAQSAILAMDQIKSSSDQISKITKVIDEIAFQTNLLALNAGVEAARAGDAGRGFAVVATEVRALAQRSADAAREISELILASETQVNTGVELVESTGTSLSDIVASISEITELVASIAASTKEQALGLNEVNDAMTQLDQVTQQNAAMFEETAAASQALNTETDALSDAVSHFKLADPKNAPAEDLAIAS